MAKNIIPFFLAPLFLTSLVIADPPSDSIPLNGIPSHLPTTNPRNFSIQNFPKNFSAPGSSTNNSGNTSDLNDNSESNSPTTDPSSSNPPLRNIPKNFPGFPGNAGPLGPLPLNPSQDNAIGLDPHNNNPLPIEIECDIARLLVLEKNPVIPNDGGIPFAVVARVYTSLLNLFATDDPSQKIMYTDDIRPYIAQHIDPNGNYFYTAVPGSEETLLGYSQCLSATTFRDVLCKDQNTLFTLDANVDSNQQDYFWVHFSTIFLTNEDGRDNGLTHYQWINRTGPGNYYDFYLTKDHPDLSQFFANSSNLCVRSFTGNIWVGTRDNGTHPTHDWTVTGNNSIGLLISEDGRPFVKIVDDASPSPTQPTEPSKNSNNPSDSNSNKSNESAWDDFIQNGAGSAWDDYLQRTKSSSHNNQNVATPVSSTPASPASSDNNSSQPAVDKETLDRAKLAVKLRQQGLPLDQIAAKTGFTEEQLQEIFSHLSQ